MIEQLIVSVPCIEVKTKTLSFLSLATANLITPFAAEAEFSETVDAFFSSQLPRSQQRRDAAEDEILLSNRALSAVSLLRICPDCEKLFLKHCLCLHYMRFVMIWQ